MGNLSNPNQWATMERLRFIERRAYWCGTITRQDLTQTFGLSMAQASSDLQKYQEMNAEALIYNLRKKRYEGTQNMCPILTTPNLEEAMSLFLTGDSRAPSSALFFVGEKSFTQKSGQVQTIQMPSRRPPAEVQRRVFLAVSNQLRLRVRYLSVNSSTDAWRELHPRAFGHDGSRWHVRAWCELRREWRDFTLSRFVKSEWPTQPLSLPGADEAWEKFVTLSLRANQKLSPTARKAVELDYGMINGRLELPVREAMVNYLLTRLNLPLTDGARPFPQLELME